MKQIRIKMCSLTSKGHTIHDFLIIITWGEQFEQDKYIRYLGYQSHLPGGQQVQQAVDFCFFYFSLPTSRERKTTKIIYLFKT